MNSAALDEISKLIAIRNFVFNTVQSNHAVEKAAISELNGMLILIDRKIIAELRSPEFKDFIDYENVKEAIRDVANINNIRSGMKPLR